MPIKYCFFSLLGLVLLVPVEAKAQLGRADTRTVVPEVVMKERKQWGADLAFGGSFNRGNVSGNNLSGNFDIFKNYTRSTAYITGSMAYCVINHRQLNNQGALTLRYDHAVKGNWKIFAFSTNAYNRVIHLDYRTTTGIGPWYNLSLGETKHGISLAGIREYEEFSGGIREHSWRVSLRDISRVPVSPVAELSSDLFYSPKADEFGDYHFFQEIALRTLIWRDTLGLKLSWAYLYDSRPRPGIKPGDILWQTSLTLQFGR